MFSGFARRFAAWERLRGRGFGLRLGGMVQSGSVMVSVKEGDYTGIGAVNSFCIAWGREPKTTKGFVHRFAQISTDKRKLKLRTTFGLKRDLVNPDHCVYPFFYHPGGSPVNLPGYICRKRVAPFDIVIAGVCLDLGNNGVQECTRDDERSILSGRKQWVFG
jgi:hypothetical protein